MSPHVWGEMRLFEFLAAIDGFNELEEERLRWQFFNTRKICWFIAKTTGNDITEQEIIPIKELDDEIDRTRIDDLPIIKVEIDGLQ